ncbi:AAA family ATPase [Clavibacter tessellarius]|uniref:AAA family ATPase n=1 Tax=Clavibacter tessellarius TaxID=31965 RepID=UPI003245FC31
MTNAPLSLVRAEVTKVLGEYDHSITFRNNDDFVIIYGPNGVGKTRFLEVIDALSRMEGSKLTSMPFGEATLTYSDSSTLSVKTVEQDSQPSSKSTFFKRQLLFTLRRPDAADDEWHYMGGDFENWLVETTPWRPIGDDLWEDRRDGEVASLAGLENRYPEGGGTKKSRIPPAFLDFRTSSASYLIETQRLRIEQERPQRVNQWRVNHQERSRSSQITEHASKMRTLVNDAQTEHSTITQQLDRTFPNRILSESTADKDADGIRRRYEEQNEFRSRLGRVVSVALADALSLPDRTLEDWEVRLLNLYLDDADDKLAPFETLLLKIELLEAIINSRLLNKKLQITARDGLTVLHTPDGRIIDLDSLSSGEQHEIILMFDLLFNVPSGATVLIDEPEISLHVVWQLAFIPDVQRIAALAGFRFVVATHSPQIINDQWDRAIRLGPLRLPFSERSA